MERNFHQVIYSGLLISFVPIITILLLAWTALLIWSHLILPTYVDWIRRKFSHRRKMVKFRRFWFGRRNEAEIEKSAKSLFTRVSIGLLLSVFYILSLIYFESIGTNKAEVVLDNHNSSKNKTEHMIQVEIENKLKKLRFLACGARTCAGIEEETNLVYYFSATTSYSFLHHETEATELSRSIPPTAANQK